MIVGIESHDENNYYTERYIIRNSINQGGSIVGRYAADGLFVNERAHVPANTGFGSAFWEIGPDAASQIWAVHTGNGTRSLASIGTEFVVGLDIKNSPDQASVMEREIITASYYDTGVIPVKTVRRMTVLVDNLGKLRLFSNPTRTFGNWWIENYPLQTLAITDNPVIIVNEWCYLEVQFIHLSATSGRVNAYKNGVQVWASDPVAIYNAPGFTQAGQANVNFGSTGYARDNCYISTGEVLGPCRAHATVPKYTRRADWTKVGSGIIENHQAIDEMGYTVTAPNKADYVSAVAAGAIDLYSMTNAPTLGTTLALQVNAFVGVPTTLTPPRPDSSIRFVAKSPGGSLYYSDIKRVPGNYQGNSNFAGGYDATFPYVDIFHVWEESPEGPWNENALLEWQFGFELMSNVETRVIQFNLERLFPAGGGAFSIYRARMD